MVSGSRQEARHKHCGLEGSGAGGWRPGDNTLSLGHEGQKCEARHGTDASAFGFPQPCVSFIWGHIHYGQCAYLSDKECVAACLIMSASS